VERDNFGALDKDIGKSLPVLNQRRRALNTSDLQPAGAVV
jgi:hypothetical protein